LAAVHEDLSPLDRSAHASDATQPHSHSTPATTIYATLLLCGLLARSRRKMRLPSLLAIALLAIAGAGLTGCGGGNTVATVPSSPTNYYTVTLRATDSVNSSITASTAFTLSVN
jgi:hypothetical protein